MGNDEITITYKNNTGKRITRDYLCFGCGSFSSCYKYINDSSKVLIELDKRYREKDIFCKLVEIHPFFPYIKHIGTDEENNYYEMEYYRDIDENDYEKYPDLKNNLDALDKLFVNTYIKRVKPKEIKALNIPNDWKDAILIIREAALKDNYNKIFKWDFREPNFGLNEANEIIFRDPIFTPSGDLCRVE